MVANPTSLQQSIDTCIASGQRLLDDAEWLTHRDSTGVALAMSAQEGFAKAFVITLVRDGILPWTDDIRNSLRVHECKHLLTMIMEWLVAVNERRSYESLNACQDDEGTNLPPDVAIVMNIYRHEMIERIAGRSADHYPEWRGRARKVAQGKRDRKKQAALYVDIREDGGVASAPMMTAEEFRTEFARAERLMEFARDADRKCIFAFKEYELFSDVFRSMLADSAETPEEYSSGIPGIVFVKTTITVAEVGPRF